MNKTILIGRLTKDVEIKTTQTGKKVASFNLAINEGKDDTQFFNCVAWEKKAEVLEKYSSKGSKICIIGKLQNRSYEKDGVKKYITEILANEIELLGNKKEQVENDFINIEDIDKVMF